MCTIILKSVHIWVYIYIYMYIYIYTYIHALATCARGHRNHLQESLKRKYMYTRIYKSICTHCNALQHTATQHTCIKTMSKVCTWMYIYMYSWNALEELEIVYKKILKNSAERKYIWYRVTHVCVGGYTCMCWCNIYDCHKSVTYRLCMCLSYMSSWHISAWPYE